MHVNVDNRNIEIDITDAHKELHGWVEIIGKTANKICDDPDYNRIKLNEQQAPVLSLSLMMLADWAAWAGLSSECLASASACQEQRFRL